MTTYYVDFINGLDANNGLGPDASHSTNKPWKTMAKVLGASGITSGDTVYMSPAGPFREVVTIAMTSAVAETFILGDPWNDQGFKTSGGVLVSPGPVIWTAYTTNDETTPSTTSLLTLSGRDFLTFRNIMFIGANNANAGSFLATTTTSTNIKIEDCAFLTFHNRQHIQATTVFGTSLTWTIDRCYFGPTSTTGITLNGPQGAGADYDMSFIVRNSVSVACGTSGEFINLNSTGSSTHKPGGGVLQNCSIFFSRAMATDAGWATSIPGQVKNCVIYHLADTGITAGAASTISEDWNLFFGTTALSGTPTSGGNSVTTNTHAPLINMMGQDRIWTAPEPRPYGEPLRDSPLLVFGNDGNQTAYDLVNLPRPATSLAAVGAFGTRHNTFTRDSSPIGGGGPSALRIVGPGDYGFRIPVSDGVSVDISIDVQWDATYAGTKPQFRVDSNLRIGVSAETITATGSSGSPETLTLSTITPDGDGDFIIVRVISNDTNGGGLVQTDDLTIT